MFKLKLLTRESVYRIIYLSVFGQELLSVYIHGENKNYVLGVQVLNRKVL